MLVATLPIVKPCVAVQPAPFYRTPSRRGAITA